MTFFQMKLSLYNYFDRFNCIAYNTFIYDYKIHIQWIFSIKTIPSPKIDLLPTKEIKFTLWDCSEFYTTQFQSSGVSA